MRGLSGSAAASSRRGPREERVGARVKARRRPVWVLGQASGEHGVATTVSRDAVLTLAEGEGKMRNGGRENNGKPRGPSGATRVRREQFLATLAATCNVRLACETAGVSLSWTYQARARDAEFAERWEEALQQGYVMLEGELMRRALGDALTGTAENPAAGDGQRPFDPLLAIRMLDQRRRADPQGRRVPARLKQPDRQTVLASIERKLTAIEKQLERKR